MRFFHLCAFVFALALAAAQSAAGREMAGHARRLTSDEASSSTSSSSLAHRGAAASKSTLPEITLYGEALCPDTAAFVTRVLGPLLDAGAVVGKGASVAQRKQATATTPTSTSTTTLSVASTPTTTTKAPLAEQPGGGFLSAHSGGPAPTEINASAASGASAAAAAASPPAKLVSISSVAAAAPSEDKAIAAPAASAAPAAPAAPAAAVFRFVPWGKAKRASGQSKVTCQHGPRECELNRLLGCAQAKVPAGAFPATLRCYFGSSPLGKEGTLEKCVGDGALYSRISSCASGPEGASLEQAAGDETLKEQAALTFVPWVVVDGKPLKGECGQALRAACDAGERRGISPLAPACSSLPALTTDDCPGAP